MSATRTCFFLSTTSFDSRKQARKCQRCWAERQARLAISRPLLLRWVICRSELHRQKKDRLLRSKPFMFQLTISLIPRLQRLSRRWTRPSCYSVPSPSSLFIQQSIRWHQHRKRWRRRLSARSIITSREVCSVFCSVIRRSEEHTSEL